MVAHRPFALGALLFTVSGCALSPGGAFAELTAKLSAGWEGPTDRAMPDGWLRLASDFQLKVDLAALALEEISLQDLGAASAAGFDPANPPEGYGACHGGHCHRDDGAVVPYEEIVAEADGRQARTVVSLPVGALDLLAAPELELACEPSCALPRSHVRKAAAHLHDARFEGRVRDGRSPPRFAGEARFRYSFDEAAQPETVLVGTLDLPADRSAPTAAQVRFQVMPGPQLFDEVDFAALTAVDGILELSPEVNPAAAALVRAQLVEVPLTAVVRRGN